MYNTIHYNICTYIPYCMQYKQYYTLYISNYYPYNTTLIYQSYSVWSGDYRLAVTLLYASIGLPVG